MYTPGLGNRLEELTKIIGKRNSNDLPYETTNLGTEMKYLLGDLCVDYLSQLAMMMK